MIGGIEAVSEAARRVCWARASCALRRSTPTIHRYAHHDLRLLLVLRAWCSTIHRPRGRTSILRTGDVLERLDSSNACSACCSMPCRASIFPSLAYRPAWDVVVLTLSMLGLALSVTAVVIAWVWAQRLRGTSRWRGWLCEGGTAMDPPPWPTRLYGARMMSAFCAIMIEYHVEHV